MKKHHLILVCLLGSLLVWCYSILNLSGPESVTKLIFGLAYLVSLGLLIPIVSYNQNLNVKSKIGWIVFGLILTPALPLIYYFKYKDEIQRIIVDMNKKIKEGPASLSEFDSRANR